MNKGITFVWPGLWFKCCVEYYQGLKYIKQKSRGRKQHFQTMRITIYLLATFAFGQTLPKTDKLLAGLPQGDRTKVNNFNFCEIYLVEVKSNPKLKKLKSHVIQVYSALRDLFGGFMDKEINLLNFGS